MRASLDADWQLLSPEHKAALNDMTLKPRLANEDMLNKILDKVSNPNRCSCGQIAPKGYDADTSCCARGSSNLLLFRAFSQTAASFIVLSNLYCMLLNQINLEKRAGEQIQYQTRKESWFDARYVTKPSEKKYRWGRRTRWTANIPWIACLIDTGYVCWSVNRMAASFDSSINDEVSMIKTLFESTLRKIDISFGLVIVWKDNNPHITDNFKVIKPRAHLICSYYGHFMND